MSEHMNGGSHAAPKKGPKPIIEQMPVVPSDAGAGEAWDAETSGASGAATFDDVPTAAASGGHASLHDATAGFFRSAGRFAWAYVNAHPHAVLYGVVGLLLAVLILSIGLWDTLVIAVFAGVGVIIGQMVDGDNALVNFIGRMINGRK